MEFWWASDIFTLLGFGRRDFMGMVDGTMEHIQESNQLGHIKKKSPRIEALKFQLLFELALENMLSVSIRKAYRMREIRDLSRDKAS